MKRLKLLWRNQVGASAVEFALVVPLFATLIFAMINVSMALWAAAALHYTVDAAARCQAVLTGTCDNAADTQTWAAAHYVGPRINPTFTVGQSSTCASEVDASATWVIHVWLVNATVPLLAKSCFPSQFTASAS